MPSALSFKEKARRFEATGPGLGAPSCAPRRKRRELCTRYLHRHLFIFSAL